MKSLLLIFVLAVTFFVCKGKNENNNNKLLYLTVASNQTDGFKRFMRSASKHGYDVKALGMGETWRGGDMNFAGGGYKVNLLLEELEKHKNNKDLIVVFTDSYDVILTANQEKLLQNFHSMKANLVFGAEDFCWPDKQLADEYPIVLHGYRYLNSGGFIGYAPQMYEMLSQRPVADLDDDQLYYSKVFLNSKVRLSIGIKLDTQAKIFQNLHGNVDDISLKIMDSEEPHILNTVYQTKPVVIHGNGHSKKTLNALGNYLVPEWPSEDVINIDNMKKSDYPKVLIGFFASVPTPFIEESLAKIAELNYPKKRIYLYIYNDVPSHEKTIRSFIEDQKDEKYLGLKYVSSEDPMKNWHAKAQAVDRCNEIDCDFFFNVDSEVHLDNPETLKLLISYNKPVITPIITQLGKLWSTFWGDVTENGYYARSTDYMDIVNGKKVGIWNVPHIYAVMLIHRKVLENPETKPNFVYKLHDNDLALSYNFRQKNVFMFAVNLEPHYGHLVINEAVATENLHNDLWQVAANPRDWEEKYLNPMYAEALNPDSKNEMPCPDVYWFPVFSKRFCKELIETMENLGEWSGGKNEDPRLNGGYENVPTDDIHMNQVGFEQEWLFILKTYIKPLAEKVFLGYTSDARAIMNFVVRYKPTKQSFLRPHHDSSTYTINVGLNRYKIDYEGGGSHFLRQQCSVRDTKVGWAIMHPGRLTHYHEGLPTTNGTRYIMVSFIDP